MDQHFSQFLNFLIKQDSQTLQCLGDAQIDCQESRWTQLQLLGIVNKDCVTIKAAQKK
jgi:hypothetical protein